MNVSDIMIRRIYTVPEESTVQEAARIMDEHEVGSLVVVNALGSYIGIVTERDFVKKVLRYGRSATTTYVSDIMTTYLITIDAQASLLDASKSMDEHHIRRLLVTVKGQIRGIVTNRLLLQHLRYSAARGLVGESSYRINEF